jgi:membrane-associated phospholipid phosphatase
MTQALDTPAAPRMRFMNALYLPPLLLFAAVIFSALVLNQWTQLHWQVPALGLIWIPGLFCGLIAVYAVMRSQSAILEIGIYLGFWLVFPVFAAQLTYVATRAEFPLQDNLFIGLDGMLGFDWVTWMRVELNHPLLLAVQRFAYDSSYWQPLSYIPLFALFGPRGRNGEFLTSILLALIATTVVFMILPTLGPASMAGPAGVESDQSGIIIRALRGGSSGPYPYSGIISFPSLHTALALLFTAAHRGNRITFPPVLILNLMMLTAVPYLGDHYLIDMIAGAAIAAAAFYGARWLYRRLDNAPASGWAAPFGAGPAGVDGRDLEKLDPAFRA